MYRGTVIKNESLDPDYKVQFSFSNDKFYIREGYAFFHRIPPVPKVHFDDFTDYLIEKLELDQETIQNLRLEIGKTVCDYIFATMELKKF